jgi:hypothetical protein
MVPQLDCRPRVPSAGPGVARWLLLVSAAQPGRGASCESRDRAPRRQMGRCRGRLTFPPTPTVVAVG